MSLECQGTTETESVPGRSGVVTSPISVIVLMPRVVNSKNNFTTVLENDSGNDQNALVTETIKSIQLNGMCLSLLLHHIECFQTHARFIFFYYFFGYFFLVISLFSLPLGIQTKSTIIDIPCILGASASRCTGTYPVLRKEDNECSSGDEVLGDSTTTPITLQQCSDKCTAKAGCQFFCFGKAGSSKAGRCYYEKTTSANCDGAGESWVPNTYNFYENVQPLPQQVTLTTTIFFALRHSLSSDMDVSIFGRKKIKK